MTDRLDAVLEETGRVREEIGWPVMATPPSQLVGTQAVLNVVGGERYDLVPDQVVAYAAGHYGEPPAPIDPDVLDRIMSADNAPRVTANPPEQPTLDDLRARHGTAEGEDDLLILKALIPKSDIAAMQAAGPIAQDFPLLPRELAELKTLIEATTPNLRVATEHWSLDLRR